VKGKRDKEKGRENAAEEKRKGKLKKRKAK